MYFSHWVSSPSHVKKIIPYVFFWYTYFHVWEPDRHGDDGHEDYADEIDDDGCGNDNDDEEEEDVEDDDDDGNEDDGPLSGYVRRQQKLQISVTIVDQPEADFISLFKLMNGKICILWSNYFYY